MYTLGQASRTSGKAKSTLSRDIKIGKLSAARQENGQLLIDPAELARVYKSNGSNTHQKNEPVPLGETLFERLLAEKDARIAALEADKEDLRRRLDQATALLTDQRAKSSQNEGLAARRPWWRLWR